MARVWTALVVRVAPELAEGVASFLIDHGAPGLITEEEGERVRLTAHFEAEPPVAEVAALCARLDEMFPGAAPADVESQAVPESDWSEAWKAHFPAQAIGEQLFVHPPWIDAVPPGRLGVMIDPGMAFGTGQHATTRGCLVLLERALRVRPGARVCDVGTGSGILAIAAAKLGAAVVWAADTDPAASAIARANAAANGVAGAVSIVESFAAVPGHFDVIVANLLSGPLIELAPAFVTRLVPGGVVIGAGLQNGEQAAVAAAWAASGLVRVEAYEDDPWVTLLYRHE